MENNTEAIQAKWRELTEEFEPKIAEARQEVEAANAVFEQARARRDAATDAHKRLVDRYGAEWDVVGKSGGR